MRRCRSTRGMQSLISQLAMAYRTEDNILANQLLPTNPGVSLGHQQHCTRRHSRLTTPVKPRRRRPCTMLALGCGAVWGMAAPVRQCHVDCATAVAPSSRFMPFRQRSRRAVRHTGCRVSRWPTLCALTSSDLELGTSAPPFSVSDGCNAERRKPNSHA